MQSLGAERKLSHQPGDPRDLKSLGRDELLSYTKIRHDELRPRSISEFQKMDRVLCEELLGRGLDVADIFGKARVTDNEQPKSGVTLIAEHSHKKYRSWKFKTDEQVLAIAQTVVDDNQVSNKTRLWDVDSGLADRLRRRKLWDRIKFHGTEASATKKQEPIVEVHSGPHTEEKHEPTSGEGSAWEKSDVLFLAQSTVMELELSNIDELKTLDPELHELVMGLCVEGEIRFAKKDEPGACPPPTQKEDKNPDGEFLQLGAEQLRKLELKGREIGEEMIYRLIFAECFRVGAGNPYIGGMRGTIPKLQSNMNRKLSGPQHKLFRKCWERMAAEGTIDYNQNRTAASINPSTRKIRNEKLSSALSWAIAEQMKVSTEWRMRFASISG